MVISKSFAYGNKNKEYSILYLFPYGSDTIDHMSSKVFNFIQFLSQYNATAFNYPNVAVTDPSQLRSPTRERFFSSNFIRLGNLVRRIE